MELRLDICVKDGSERTWSHEQVSQKSWEWRPAGGRRRGGAVGRGVGAEEIMEGQHGRKLLGGTFGTWINSWLVPSQI